MRQTTREKFRRRRAVRLHLATIKKAMREAEKAGPEAMRKHVIEIWRKGLFTASNQQSPFRSPPQLILVLSGPDYAAIMRSMNPPEMK